MKDTEHAILLERITVNPNIMTGKPTIRTMRLTVEHVLKALAAGLTFEQLKEDYPFLEYADIQASMLYAAELVASKKVFANAA